MQDHFDMDELLHHLISNGRSTSKTTAHLHLRAFEPSPLRQRSFFFSFKYYTTIASGLAPAAWQAHASADDNDSSNSSSSSGEKQQQYHVDISECSAVVALSLAGDPVQYRNHRSSSSNSSSKRGVLYDPLSPFQVLSLQWFADRIGDGAAQHSFVGDGGASSSWCCGPLAFLECVAAEYRAAVVRLLRLHEEIMELVVPTVSCPFAFFPT